MNNEIRSMIWEKKVADYIIKEDPNSLDYIVSAIRQFEMNQNTLVLVVDESDSHRAYISELLYVRKFRVLNASDCETALEILRQYPDIKMVIADFEMSSLDGCSFCRRIRENNKIEDVGIVGFTPSDDRMVGVKFIKSGASDYVVKNPFIVEEFYSKINRILEIVNLYSLLRETTP